MLRSPSLLATEYRDSNTNLEHGKNFAVDLKVIDLMLMIPVSHFLAR
jgi:hypothetical protein